MQRNEDMFGEKMRGTKAHLERNGQIKHCRSKHLPPNMHGQVTRVEGSEQLHSYEAMLKLKEIL